MAFVQTATQCEAPVPMAVKDSDGYFYFPIGGGLRQYVGAGSANGVITAPIGSIAIDITNHNLEMNTDASTTWEVVGTQS
jgi:hypothetical protein